MTAAAIHAQGWEELLRAFSRKSRSRKFSAFERDPPVTDYVMLASAMESFDIIIRGLTEQEKQDTGMLDISEYPNAVVCGMCIGPHEVALERQSFAVLAHEGAHAIDRRLPGYGWGELSECVAISVEHLLCFDLVEEWEPDVVYGRCCGVTQRLIKENQQRIEIVYTLITSGLQHAWDLLDGHLSHNW